MIGWFLGGTGMRGPFIAQTLNLVKDRRIPIATVLDVGVFTGTTELMQAFPAIHHVLIEPVADLNPEIEANYRGIPHSIYNVGIAGSSGVAWLETHSMLAGQPITHSSIVAAGTNVAGRAYREVEIMRLDDLVARNSFEPPFFLKIDIDGSELAAMRGAANVLRETSVLMIETPKHEIGERLIAARDAGFELIDLAEHAYYDGTFWQCDAVFVRNDLYREHFLDLQSDFRPELFTLFRSANAGSEN